MNLNSAIRLIKYGIIKENFYGSGALTIQKILNEGKKELYDCLYEIINGKNEKLVEYIEKSKKAIENYPFENCKVVDRLVEMDCLDHNLNYNQRMDFVNIIRQNHIDIYDCLVYLVYGLDDETLRENVILANNIIERNNNGN